MSYTKNYSTIIAVGLTGLMVALASGCQSINKAQINPVAIDPNAASMTEAALPDVGELQYMTILPSRFACNTVMPMQCMAVRITPQTPDISEDVQLEPEAAAQQEPVEIERLLPFNAIEGLVPKPNTVYQIIVRPYKMDNVDANHFGQRYQLVDILSQRASR